MSQRSLSRNRKRKSNNTLAYLIAKRLFTSGNGDFAARLELKDAGERGLGGWGFGPAQDQIAMVMEEHRKAQLP